MRLRSLSLRGVTRFQDRIDVPFGTAGNGLVAVVGQNGAGKTTILEGVVAALYKGFPSRPGSLYDHCHGRDAFIEAVFDGFSWPLVAEDVVRVRLAIDAERRTTEGFVFVNTESLTSGRATEFDREIDRLFGSSKLLLASVFAAQNRAGNFLLMAKGDRKGLFVELLGLGHYEDLAERANLRRALAETELGATRRVLEMLDGEVGALPRWIDTLEQAAADVEIVGISVDGFRKREEEAVRALEQAKTADERLAGLRRELGAAVLANDAAKDSLRQAETMEPAARQAAARRRASIQAASPDEAEKRARARFDQAIDAIDVRDRRLRELAGERVLCEHAVQEVEALHAEVERLAGAAGEAARLDAETKVVEGRLLSATEKRERLKKDTALLGEVPCTEVDGWARGDSPILVPLSRACPLLAAARESETALKAEHDADDAQRALDLARVAAGAAGLKCDPIRLMEVQGLLPGLRDKAAGLSLAKDAERQLEGLHAERTKAKAESDVEIEAANTTRQRIRVELEACEAALTADLGDARKAKDDAWQRIRETEAAREKAAVALSEAQGEGRPVPAMEAALSQARQSRMEAEGAQRTADKVKASAEVEVERLQGLSVKRDECKSGLDATGREVGDWLLLQNAFGRDGLQALELEAAAPEVARLTNELLEACYGPRFSVGFETLREKKSAKGEFSEVFDVKVYDEGQERQVEALSGGERVVVGEAIGLALAIFNARRSGVRWRTIFRDETAGALDPKNAIAYVDMLRRALSLGGFDQVVFVAHQPEVWERADARLVVSDGTVRLDAEVSEPHVAAAV